MKNDFFKLKDHGTTVRREVLAGITTFMTMAYVLAVQPSAICGFGPDPYITDINGIVISKSALLVMCALVSGIITLFMGLYANLPLALSTAMGSNFILGGLVNSGTVSFGWAMALLLCSGILFILGTVESRIICNYNDQTSVYPHIRYAVCRVCRYVEAHMLHTCHRSCSRKRCTYRYLCRYFLIW